MGIGTTFILIVLAAIAVWLVLESGRIRHKILALVLIGLVVFGYFSFTNVISEKDIDVTSVGGAIKATKIYFSGLFSWTGSAINNIKTIKNQSVKLDWSLNSSENKSEK